jgi:hypothetical protein
MVTAGCAVAGAGAVGAGAGDAGAAPPGFAAGAPWPAAAQKASAATPHLTISGRTVFGIGESYSK